MALLRGARDTPPRLSNSASRVVVFSSGQTAGATKTINVTGGELLVFHLVANNTTSNFLDRNSANRLGCVNAFFSVTAANPDKVQHVITKGDAQTGNAILDWEDLLGGGDRDYNDAVISLTPAAAPSAAVGNTLRIPGVTGNQVPVTVELNPAKRGPGSTSAPPASTAPGEIGYFQVDDSSGTVNGIEPGASDYIATALAIDNRQELVSPGDSLRAPTTVQAPGGALVGFYYVPGGTVADVLANNPTNDPAWGKVVLLSFPSANPDDSTHFRWSAPEYVAVPTLPQTAGQTTVFLHGVGKLFPSSVDFDDFVLSITLPD
jgi:hypothetical protein